MFVCRSLQVSLIQEGLPHFFLAQGDQLEKSAATALDCLGLEGSNHYLLIRDETAFARTFNLVYGLREDPKEPAIVGGSAPDHALLEPGDQKSLPKEHLADVSVCTVLKGLNKRGDCYMVQMTPRKHKTTAEDKLCSIGEILEASALLSISLKFFQYFCIFCIFLCIFNLDSWIERFNMFQILSTSCNNQKMYIFDCFAAEAARQITTIRHWALQSTTTRASPN